MAQSIVLRKEYSRSLAKKKYILCRLFPDFRNISNCNFLFLHCFFLNVVQIRRNFLTLKLDKYKHMIEQNEITKFSIQDTQNISVC